MAGHQVTSLSHPSSSPGLGYLRPRGSGWDAATKRGFLGGGGTGALPSACGSGLSGMLKARFLFSLSYTITRELCVSGSDWGRTGGNPATGTELGLQCSGGPCCPTRLSSLYFGNLRIARMSADIRIRQRVGVSRVVGHE